MLGAPKTKGGITAKMRRKLEIYPLTVQKDVTIPRNESSLVLNYRLTNTTDEELEYHYSGHNTLQINPNYRIILPHGVTKLKRGMAITDRLGNLGHEIPWPITTDSDGKSVDLSKVGGPTDGTGENLYTPRLRESWAAALNESR